MVDMKTLELLAARLDEDGMSGWALQPSVARNIASLIRGAIGAPVMWPSRTAGADYAQEYYAGSPEMRLAFNHGVKWAVEHYGPTVEVKMRAPRQDGTS